MKKILPFLVGMSQGALILWFIASVWLIAGYQKRDQDRPLLRSYRSPWEDRKKTDETAGAQGPLGSN
jgi:hypothetical protein